MCSVRSEVLDVNLEIRLTLWAVVRLASSGVAHCLTKIVSREYAACRQSGHEGIWHSAFAQRGAP